jgi:NAD(P)H-flavin reductase
VTASLQVPEPRSSPMLPAVVRIRDRRDETPGVFTLALEVPGNAGPFRPGQFNMLYVFGVGEAAISLSGDPADTGTIVHTIRAVGSVTEALARLQAGDALGLRGPFGSCWPLGEARGQDVVIVAGGVGLPPLRPVIYHLLRHRSDFGRIILLYGAPTPADVLYADEVDHWRKRDDFQVLVTVDHGDSSWRGPAGVVTELFPRCRFEPQRTIGLMCGPEVMMRFTVREFLKRGVTEDRLFLSLERNMQCAVGFCGHCQFGPGFVCMDGPVFRYDRIKLFFNVREA